MRVVTTRITSREASKALTLTPDGNGESKLIKYVSQRLPPMPSYRDLLAIYGINGKKQLSQNFIMRPGTIRKLIRYSCIKSGDTVLEVGPGPGNITREILSRGPRELFVIEKDRRFLPLLEMLADAVHPGQMKILLGDVRDFNMDGFFDQSLAREWLDQSPPIQIFSNLPFNIASPLLIKWLSQIHSRTGPFTYGRVPMSLTFQWEVAQRLGADVLQYGRSKISIMTQLYCKVHRKLMIPGSHFFPKPEVNVGLVRLIPRRTPLVPSEIPFKVVDKFVKNLFHLRRKFIRRSLHLLFPRSERSLIEKICVESGVSIDDTPIMLSNDEVARMIQVYWDIIKDSPELANHDHAARTKEPQIIRDLFTESGHIRNPKWTRKQIEHEVNPIEQ